MSRRINEGHPPSTREWNEFEARQGGIGPHRSRPAKSGGKRRQKPSLPMLTDEQIVAHAKWIHARLVLLIDAFDDAPWDDRWTNRLMSALLSARNTLELASQKGTDDGMARLVDPDEEKAKPAAGGNPADGSGSQAGEA